MARAQGFRAPRAGTRLPSFSLARGVSLGPGKGPFPPCPGLPFGKPIPLPRPGPCAKPRGPALGDPEVHLAALRPPFPSPRPLPPPRPRPPLPLPLPWPCPFSPWPCPGVPLARISPLLASSPPCGPLASPTPPHPCRPPAGCQGQRLRV